MHQLARVRKQPVGEPAGVRKRDEMTALDLVDLPVEPLAGDALLELSRKEAISGPHDDVDRHVGPRVEPAWLGERDLRLGPLMGLATTRHVLGHVVQEVRGDV